MENQEVPKLATTAVDCRKAMANLVTATKSDDCPVKDVLRTIDLPDLQQRYDMWAGSQGALQDFRSPLSLVNRLRDAPSLRDHILSNLNNILDSIQIATDIATGNRPNRDITPPIDLDIDISEYDVSSSESDTSSVQSSGNEEKLLPETSEIQSLISCVKLSLDSLGKSSYFVRECERRRGTPRMEPVDDRADVMHINDRYPLLAQKKPELAIRLGEANARRRQRFERVRSERLSTVNVKSDAGVSSATSLIETSDEELPFPPVPVESQTGSPFECPYCLTSQQLKSQDLEREWREHVLQDLEPYICTFGGCLPHRYQSERDWFDHELLVHRIQWVCPACSASFGVPIDLKKHIGERHGKVYSKPQISMMTEHARRPVSSIGLNECPFCDKWTEEDFGPDNADQFSQHLGRHLQQVALFALPRVVD